MIIIRVGECRNCGECCKILDGINNLPRQCPAYLPDGVGTHCAIYDKRPWACRASPRTPRDVWVVPECGFQFADAETGKIIDSHMLASTGKHLSRAIQKRNAHSKSCSLPARA